MAEQYEGTLSADIVIHVEGIYWHTEQTDEHSDTSLKSIVEQDLHGDLADLSDISQLISESREGDVKSVKVTEFVVENHAGPGEE